MADSHDRTARVLYRLVMHHVPAGVLADAIEHCRASTAAVPSTPLGDVARDYADRIAALPALPASETPPQP